MLLMATCDTDEGTTVSPDDGGPIDSVGYADTHTDTDTDSDGPVACRVTSASGVRTSDGSALFFYAYSYDANGLLVEMARDGGTIDGSIDALTRYTHNAAGQLLTEAFDDGNDGSVDARKSWTYDAMGQLMTLESDLAADGTVESTYTYTYDAMGWLVVERFSTTLGSPGWEDSMSYDLAKLVRRDRDIGIDGTTDEQTDYDYDPTGVAVLEATTDSDDGSPIRRVTRTTDGDGNILTRLGEDFVSGTSLLTIYTYDEAGNVLTAERDPGADGTPTLLTTYTWDCF
jgi:hypothetical protein